MGNRYTLMTFAQYARHRGCTRMAVGRAAKAGRIAAIVVDGKKMVDPEVADVQWQKNSRPYIKAASTPPPRSPGPGVADELHDIAKARAKREFHEANLAELRELKESGALLARESVEKAAVEAASMLRLALEQIAGKLGSRLAVESDPDVCRALVAAEVDQALADAQRALAAAAEQ